MNSNRIQDFKHSDSPRRKVLVLWNLCRSYETIPRISLPTIVIGIWKVKGKDEKVRSLYTTCRKALLLQSNLTRKGLLTFHLSLSKLSCWWTSHEPCLWTGSKVRLILSKDASEFSPITHSLEHFNESCRNIWIRALLMSQRRLDLISLTTLSLLKPSSLKGLTLWTKH